VSVGIPPTRPRVARHVTQGIFDLETADEVKARASMFVVKPGEEDDQVTALGAAEAEGSPGAPAVVAVSGWPGREVRIEVDSFAAPATKHRWSPWHRFWNRQELEGAVRIQRRADRVRCVHADVG